MVCGNEMRGTVEEFEDVGEWVLILRDRRGWRVNFGELYESTSRRMKNCVRRWKNVLK